MPDVLPETTVARLQGNAKSEWMNQPEQVQALEHLRILGYNGDKRKRTMGSRWRTMLKDKYGGVLWFQVLISTGTIPPKMLELANTQLAQRQQPRAPASSRGPARTGSQHQVSGQKRQRDAAKRLTKHVGQEADRRRNWNWHKAPQLSDADFLKLQGDAERATRRAHEASRASGYAYRMNGQSHGAPETSHFAILLAEYCQSRGRGLDVFTGLPKKVEALRGTSEDMGLHGLASDPAAPRGCRADQTTSAPSAASSAAAASIASDSTTATPWSATAARALGSTAAGAYGRIRTVSPTPVQPTAVDLRSPTSPADEDEGDTHVHQTLLELGRLRGAAGVEEMTLVELTHWWRLSAGHPDGGRSAPLLPQELEVVQTQLAAARQPAPQENLWQAALLPPLPALLLPAALPPLPVLLLPASRPEETQPTSTPASQKDDPWLRVPPPLPLPKPMPMPMAPAPRTTPSPTSAVFDFTGSRKRGHSQADPSLITSGDTLSEGLGNKGNKESQNARKRQRKETDNTWKSLRAKRQLIGGGPLIEWIPDKPSAKVPRLEEPTYKDGTEQHDHVGTRWHDVCKGGTEQHEYDGDGCTGGTGWDTDDWGPRWPHSGDDTWMGDQYDGGCWCMQRGSYIGR